MLLGAPCARENVVVATESGNWNVKNPSIRWTFAWMNWLVCNGYSRNVHMLTFNEEARAEGGFSDNTRC